MFSLSLLCICLFSTGNLGARAAKPELPATTLQLDLVFPRPNATHQRTFPFPIIFAIHGAKSLWPHHLLLRWGLRNTENAGSPGGSDFGDFTDIGSAARWTASDYLGDDEPYYYISSSDIVGESNDTDFWLRWDAVLPANCSKGDTWPGFSELDTPQYGQPGAPRVRGYAEFRVSDDAPMDIAVDSCFPVNNTFVDGERNTLRIGGTVTPSQCIFYDEDNFRLEPKPCAAKADSALASKVTETMLASAGCTGVVWPDEVDGQCPNESSEDDEDDAGRLGERKLPAVLLSAGIGALFVMG